ncbi:adenylosuccinate lyase [Candidatus Mycoplasma mahonii]|uniref:adenylosuccinate lyase n=1 Tax=Candidatus Mycoplasma mahonii TaxID=3004105 RepID=UPI0026ED3B02|nr:adenylosuccinate lyase [Candidatus Mycoplasma mahonii]WKX02404.1 adenylosuccinate lyase [Candidatus Mycoplasma mahonii]
MIDRYSTPEMKEIWNDKAMFESWLLVEIYSIEAYAKHNTQITLRDIANLWKNAKVDVQRIKEIEKETKHDVIAFTRQISETLGDEKKWFHYGLTSTDVVDTAQSIRLMKANDLIKKELKQFCTTLKNLAKKHKYTYQIGRTHGVHAEVTTFGYKVALWYDEFTRHIKRFDEACQEIQIAKISGAVGNYANIPLDVQDYVAKKLYLASSKISSQTLQRDRHAQYIFSLASIATSMDKIATEIRHLQRTEVREVQEGFAKNQKGSSAMPHKKNPIVSENISGLSRVMRSHVQVALENVALWHERDISHSSTERVIIPDSTTMLHYMLKRFDKVLQNLVVSPENMMKNIELTNGVIFSQRVMLKVIDVNNWSREKSYDVIQPIAMKAFNEGISFKQLLIENNIMSEQNIGSCFSLDYYSRNIDAVFKRLKIGI